MFVGMGCCGSGDYISSTPTFINDVTYISISNGVYDELFGTDNSDIDMNDVSKAWDYDTRFYAKFQGNLMAGNVDYTANTVSSVRIKRRKSDEHTWLTLFEIPIEKNEDFDFEITDKYAQGAHEYFYSLVPVIENVEGNINKNSVISDFRDYFILDRNVSYHIIFNTSLSIDINKNISIINTLGKRYPFVISNGLSQYITGALTFSLAPMIDCEIDVENGYSYRKQFEEWIMNGSPKILKDWTGKIYMINITNSIPIDYESYQLPSYQIQFTEIGDALNANDLYYNNFIDYI